MIATIAPERSRILVSTSDVFPVVAHIQVKQLLLDKPRLKFLLERQGHATKDLFDVDIPEDPVPDSPVTVRREFQDQNRKFLAVITICPGKEPEARPRYLLGQIYDLKGIDPGATGVWVAEEQQPPPKGPSEEGT